MFQISQLTFFSYKKIVIVHTNHELPLQKIITNSLFGLSLFKDSKPFAIHLDVHELEADLHEKLCSKRLLDL
jgi:hypothetical protein